jgi:hypothetical protein
MHVAAATPKPKPNAVARLPHFLKGCAWSPDGLCVLTATDADNLVLFNTPAGLTRGAHATEQDTDETAAGGSATDGKEDGAGPAVPHEELTPALVMQEGEMIYDYCW